MCHGGAFTRGCGDVEETSETLDLTQGEGELMRTAGEVQYVDMSITVTSQLHMLPMCTRAVSTVIGVMAIC